MSSPHIICLLAWACAFLSNGQPLPIDKTGNTLKPISISGRFPAAFTGHRILDVVQVLETSSSILQKSEFETTEAARARSLEFLRRQPDLYIVLRESSGLYSSYDADGRKLSFSLMTDPYAIGQVGEGDVVLLNTNRVSSRQYKGVNAYGVAVNITEERFRDFGLVLGGKRFNGSFSRDMSAEIAQQSKPHLRLLLKCRIDDPLVRRSASYYKPTLANPHETYREGLYVHVSPLELSLFDDRTGEILTDFSESDEDRSVHAAERKRAELEQVKRAEIERIERATVRPRVVSQVLPVYPPLALRARIEGDVRLRGTVSRDGSLRDCTLVSGHPLLAQAAQDAVRKWTFSPGSVDGETKEMPIDLSVSFRVAESNGAMKK